MDGQPGCLMTGSPAFFFLEEEPWKNADPKALPPFFFWP
jgi:hypothetical protein